MGRSRGGHGLRLVLVSAWLAAAAVGAAWLNGHLTTAGEAGAAPAVWPERSGLMQSDAEDRGDVPRVAMFVHPRCPCTSASLDELSVAAGGGDEVRVILVASGPGVAGAEDLVDRLRRLAGARSGWSLVVDESGALARRFGAHTSGHVVVYDRLGRLVFSGGVTVARGHRGPNTGAAVVAGVASGGRAVASSAPVFGCPLFSSSAIGPAVGASGDGSCEGCGLSDGGER